jgi:hypothetical protein
VIQKFHSILSQFWKENRKYDWKFRFPEIRKDKIEDVCRIGKRVTTCQYGLVVPGSNWKYRCLSSRQFKMVSVYCGLDTRSRKIMWRNLKDLNSTLHLDHGDALRKKSREEQSRCKWSNTLLNTQLVCRCGRFKWKVVFCRVWRETHSSQCLRHLH